MADPGWPYIPARWTMPRTGRQGENLPVAWVVVHSMEVPCQPGVAASVGRAFRQGAQQASTHVGADPSGVVRYVPDALGCYGAERNSNRRGWHIEQAGYARFSRADWFTPGPLATIGHAAAAAAYACRKYGIDPRVLTDREVTAFTPGFVSHAQLTRVFGVPGGHTDPGVGYPFDLLIGKTRELLGAPVLVPVPDPGREGNRFRGFPTVGRGSRDDPARVAARWGDPKLADPAVPVLTLQTWLGRVMQAKLVRDGVCGPLTEAATHHFQSWWHDHGLAIAVDGVCGPQTWSQLDAAADFQGR